jgi:membrane protease YdiL (CAAX protease family)
VSSDVLDPDAEHARIYPTGSRLVPWSAGTAFAALALAFVVYVLGDSVLASVAIFLGLYTRDPVIFSIVAYQFLALGVALSVYWLIVRRTGAGPKALGFRFPGISSLVRALLTLAPIFVGVDLISVAFSAFFPGFHLQGNAKQELPVGTHVNLLRALLVLVWASLEAPLTEEVLFRGIIFQGITRFTSHRLGLTMSVFVGALTSGAIFGIVHGELHTLPILMFLGIALAYVFYYSHSIYASILVHGAVNAIAAISVIHGA